MPPTKTKRGAGRPTNGYYAETGKRVPSVTTVLGRFKDPGALMYWSWKVGYDVLLEAHEVVRDLAEDINVHNRISDTTANKIGEYLKSSPTKRANFREESSKACSAGTVAHDLVEHWIHCSTTHRSNMERSLSPEKLQRDKKVDDFVANAAYNSFRAFCRWVSLTNFELSETEVPLVSETYRFGGTLDCIGWIDSKLVLLDWKTSNNLYADYLLQLAAYGLLWDEHYDPPVSEYHLLRFDKKTGDFSHFSTDDLENEKKAFLAMRNLYDAMKPIERRVK